MPRITAPHLKDLNRSARLGLASAKAAPANRRRPKNAPESKPAAVSEGTPERPVRPVLQFAADELAGQLGWRNDWATGAPYSWESMVAAFAFLWKMADHGTRLRVARVACFSETGLGQSSDPELSGTPAAQRLEVGSDDRLLPPPPKGGVSWTHSDREHRAHGAVMISFAVEREADGSILIEIPELKCSGARSPSLDEALAAAFRFAQSSLIQQLNGALNATLQLQVGKTYRDRGGAHWVCYLVDAQALRSRQAACIRVGQHFTRYFFIDGRHDPDGSDEFTLVAEVP